MNRRRRTVPLTIRKVLKWAGVVLGVFVLIAIGLGIYFY